MPVSTYTDSNGLTYKAIGTAAWYGAEGATLRAQGWTYCGLGTNGIIIAPPGGQCFTQSSAPPPPPPPPDIGPPPPPSEPSSAVPDQATKCGRCGPISTQGMGPRPITGLPTTTPPTRTQPPGKFPWWVWVLIALTLAEVVNRGRNT